MLMPGPSASLSAVCRHFPMLLALLLLIAFQPARADELSDVQRLYQSGQPVEAMKRADEYLAGQPKDAPMRFFKAVMLADAKRNPEATALLEALIQDFPDLAEPYNNLAVLYASAGEYDKARATLGQALRTNPTYATAHENLGDVYAALAAQSYAEAQKLDPGNRTLPTKLALIRESYKRPGSAASAVPR